MRSQTVHLRLIRISATVCKRCSSSEAWPAKACDKWQLQQFSIIFYLSLEICTQREGSLFSCFLIKMATSGYTAWFVFLKPLAFGFQFVWIQPIFFFLSNFGIFEAWARHSARCSANMIGKLFEPMAAICWTKTGQSSQFKTECIIQYPCQNSRIIFSILSFHNMWLKKYGASVRGKRLK